MCMELLIATLMLGNESRMTPDDDAERTMKPEGRPGNRRLTLCLFVSR
jgi:hypothetical protein